MQEEGRQQKATWVTRRMSFYKGGEVSKESTHPHLSFFFSFLCFKINSGFLKKFWYGSQQFSRQLPLIKVCHSLSPSKGATPGRASRGGTRANWVGAEIVAGSLVVVFGGRSGEAGWANWAGLGWDSLGHFSGHWL